jgi:hypothetical protein
MEMKWQEPEMCDSCKWKIESLLTIYLTDTQKLLKRYCSRGNDKCFKEFLQWVFDEFPNQPERSKREDVIQDCTFANPCIQCGCKCNG